MSAFAGHWKAINSRNKSNLNSSNPAADVQLKKILKLQLSVAGKEYSLSEKNIADFEEFVFQSVLVNST